jgi:CheY-like chemotaxis protein
MACTRPVLIVEDEPDVRQMLVTWLTVLGRRSLTASNGAEGLRVARAHHPCLILLDFMMPVMDGRQFRRAQASDPEIRDVPVVLTTAHPKAKELARDLHLDVIEKPVDMEAIEAVVAQYCGDADPAGT